MNKVEEAKKLNDESTLSRRTFICYGVGHMLNDLTSSMWFCYLLLFFHYGLNFTYSESGLMLLIGQVADALATPVVGILSDRGAGHWMCKYGHRKSWHLLGTLCVAATFPFIFSPCFGFEYLERNGKLVYYSIFIIIFQLGWASVQVAHLSLAPDLTPHQNERTGLLTIRYSFTVFANIIVHLFTWMLFASYRNKGSNKTIGSEDRPKFQIIALFVVAVGSVFSLIFHAGVSEHIHVRSTKTKEDQQTITKKKSVLTQSGLYHIMGIYMMSQLYVNQSQVFIPLYLEEYLGISAERLPMLPLIMYISSSLTSIITKALNTNCGRKPAYIIGSVLAVFTCIIVRFGEGKAYTSYLVYVVSAAFGCASSIIMVTSQGIVADLIGEHTKHGAFVYGLMSFADKMSNGVAVMIIQYGKGYSESTEYYRDMLILMCGGSVVIGLLFVTALPKDFRLFGKKMDEDSANATRIVYCLDADHNNESNIKS